MEDSFQVDRLQKELRNIELAETDEQRKCSWWENGWCSMFEMWTNCDGKLRNQNIGKGVMQL